MKAWIAKYNAQPVAYKGGTDQLVVEFLLEDGPLAAQALGFGCWEQARFDVVCFPTGIILRGSPAFSQSGRFREKIATLRKMVAQPDRRINFHRAASKLTGLELVPEFGLGEVQASRDESSRTIFIPIPIPGDRKLVKGRFSKLSPPTLLEQAEAAGVVGIVAPAPKVELSGTGKGLPELIHENLKSHAWNKPAEHARHEPPPIPQDEVVDCTFELFTLENMMQAPNSTMDKTFTMTLRPDKETKGCHRYYNSEGDRGVATIYVTKESLDGVPPAKISVTIEEAPGG